VGQSHRAGCFATPKLPHRTSYPPSPSRRPFRHAAALPRGTKSTRNLDAALDASRSHGTIASLYGLNAGIITRTQFSLLIGVVILSAVIPTAIAQRFFQAAPHDDADATPIIPDAQEVH